MTQLHQIVLPTCYSYGEPYLRARIVGALGGRAAGQLIYGTATTGTENDIKQVTELARAMLTCWGMSPEAGLLALSRSDDGTFLESGLAGGAMRPYSQQTAQGIDRAIRQIVDECSTKAVDLLTRERGRLEALAVVLLREESLNEAQMRTAAGLEARPVAEPALAVNHLEADCTAEIAG
jgi:cell division protease FtsH